MRDDQVKSEFFAWETMSTLGVLCSLRESNRVRGTQRAKSVASDIKTSRSYLFDGGSRLEEINSEAEGV